MTDNKNMIFISSRAGDTAEAAVAVDQRLCRAFGESAVFRSSRSIAAGRSFPPELVTAAANCAAMVVLIGRDWLAAGPDGIRRIDGPADWVRTEIELALAEDRPVIPVLVGGRDRLDASDKLPVSIAGLVNHQYLRLHHRSAARDLLHLVDELRRYVATRGTDPPRPTAAVRLTSLTATNKADVRKGGVRIAGRYYGDSLIYRPSVFPSAPRGSVSYDLGKQYRLLEVTVGVLDNTAETDQVGVFEVFLDRVACERVTVTHGRPRDLTIDVTDVLHLRLEAHRPGMTRHPMMAGVKVADGVSNKLPELGWGDPVIHP